MDKKLSKDDILENMVNEMPFEIYESVLPYIKIAMDIHSKQTAIGFAEWYFKMTRIYVNMERFEIDHPELMDNGKLKTAEQLYSLYLQSL